METDRQIAKCMIKRSKSVLSTIFNISFLKFIIIGTLLMGVIYIPIFGLNLWILDYICAVLSISKEGLVREIGNLVILIASLIESILVWVCISCLPIFEKYADKIMVWIGDFP